MNCKGYLLIELCLALLMFSIAGSCIYLGFFRAFTAAQRIEHEFRTETPASMMNLQIEKDIRNAVNLKEYPFQGKADELKFPVYLARTDKNGHKESRLFLIRYGFKGQRFIRSEEMMGQKESKEKVLLKDREEINFRFPYRNEEDDIIFQSFWLTKPYQGIPLSIEVNLKKGKTVISKLVNVPQGRLGNLSYAHE